MTILYSKFMLFFVGSGFLESHCGLRKPRQFYGLSSLGTMCDYNWWVFHQSKDLSLFVDTRHIFSISCNHTTLLDIVPLPSPPNRTPNAVSIYQPCTHTHEMQCYPCICNAKCHCMFYHVTCIMNTTWNNL